MRSACPIIFLMIAGCASIELPVAPSVTNNRAIEVVQGSPEISPKGLSRFEESQLYFVDAEHASGFVASILVPIPFVSDAIIDSSRRQADSELERQYEALSVFEITLNELDLVGDLDTGTGGYRLYPMVFMEECFDGLYRLSVAYQLEQSNWMSRYYYHLGVTIPVDTIGAPTQELIDEISGELHSGARELMRLIERDISGSLTGTGKFATIGSLYIVGSRLAGITSPELLQYRHSEILEETQSGIIARLAGDPSGDARSGGLAFGVHIFDRSQLHTFTEETAEDADS
jgi:hypothetical protein